MTKRHLPLSACLRNGYVVQAIVCIATSTSLMSLATSERWACLQSGGFLAPTSGSSSNSTSVTSKLVVLVNYTGRRGYHFGQQGASYIQERVLQVLLGDDINVKTFWQPRYSDQLFKEFVRKAFLVVANAEGTLHDKRVGLLDTLKAVQRLQVPLWIINASFSFKPSSSFSKEVESIMAKAHYVAVRDALSLGNLQALAHVPRAVYSADLTLLLGNDFEKEVKLTMENMHPSWETNCCNSTDKLQIVLSGSSRDEHLYPQFWIKLLKIVIAEFPKSSFAVVLAPQKFAMEVQSHFPQNAVTYFQHRRSMAEVLWLMVNANLHIGGRFHAVTYSFLANLPTIAFPGNTWKVSSFITALRLEHFQFSEMGIRQGPLSVWNSAKNLLHLRKPIMPVWSKTLTNLRLAAFQNFPPCNVSASLQQKVDIPEIQRQALWLANLKLADKVPQMLGRKLDGKGRREQ